MVGTNRVFSIGHGLSMVICIVDEANKIKNCMLVLGLIFIFCPTLPYTFFQWKNPLFLSNLYYMLHTILLSWCWYCYGCNGMWCWCLHNSWNIQDYVIFDKNQILSKFSDIQNDNICFCYRKWHDYRKIGSQQKHLHKGGIEAIPCMLLNCSGTDQDT